MALPVHASIWGTPTNTQICYPLPRVTSNGLWSREEGPLQAALPLFLFQLSVMFLVSNLTHLLLRPLRATVGPFPFFLSAILAITAFPNLAHVLSEFGILNTELGRISMTLSMFHDAWGWFLIVVFICLKAFFESPLMLVWVLLMLTAVILFVLFVYRPWTKRVVRRNPKATHLKKGYLSAIVLGVSMIGFFTNSIGGFVADGALLFGLATPDGPPLGEAIVNKVEAFVLNVFLPPFFMWSGMIVNVSLVEDWKSFGLLPVIVLVGSVMKFIGIVLPSLCFNMPRRSAALLGLIMNIRGMIELVVFLEWRNAGLIQDATYTVIVLCITATLMITTPVVTLMYKPLWRDITSTVRTIHNSRADAELRILMCMNEEGNVPPLVNLLEVSHATQNRPIHVYALRLVELVARSSPVLVAHKNRHGCVKSSAGAHPILNALLRYEELKKGSISIEPFTAISPYKTMHQDVCALALEKLVSLIVVPFRRSQVTPSVADLASQAVRSITPEILAEAPCSVGLLVDRRGFASAPHRHARARNVAMLFVGGPDDREALAYATRMGGTRGVDGKKDDERYGEERRLDDGAVMEFRTTTRGDSRIVFREFVVGGMEDMVGKIRMMEEPYDLLVVGRQRGVDSRLTDGLTEWNEWPELGVIGDMVASSDFGNSRVTSGGLFHGVNPLEFSLPLLLFQISVMFVVSNAVHFLLKPLKQPRIVSNIIGGIILGPSGFGRNKAFADKMYPPRSLMTLETASIFGMMYSVFLVGLKMDPTIIIRTGRRSIIIATCSILASFSAVCLAAHLLPSSLPRAIIGTPLLVFISAVLSITCFPNLAHTLTELDLLNTELGRLSMSVSMIHDAIGWCLMALFITLRAGYNDAPRALYALSSLAALAFFVVFVYRPWVRLVVRRTPKGEMCVKEGQVMGILLSVGVVGFLVNAIGGTAMDGALFLGLATPEGSTLSAAMTEKTEGVVAATLIPLLFLWSGIITDVRLVRDREGVALIAVIVLVGCVAKIAGTMIPSLYFRMPLQNAVMLALIMNIKGLIEILIFLQWRNTGLMDDASYTMIVLSMTVVLVVIAPLISMSYKPQRQKLSLNARTIQHSPPHGELCVLACIHNEDSVPSILNLIESTHATPQTPLRVVVLRLVELAGLASSALIPHKNRYGHLIHRDHHHPDHVVNAFACYERSKPCGEVWVDPFTTVSPVKSMHQDVCALAQEKLAALIVVPFHDKAARATARGVLEVAPCSVGLLVDRGMYSVVGSVERCPQRIGALFFGGRDDREALAYARRMAGNPYATLVVARFLPKWDARAEERVRDEEAVEEIRYLMMHNGRVAYEEFEVEGVEEMMEVVRGMEGRYDLVMVGRRSGAGSRLTDGLTEWSEWPELGVVGDVLASSDFGDSTSVLVMQQHG
ncbi:Cation/H(+) antiporter 15 [Acorus calamus]|uniref:Cation/H(+) antiporter 15 n=1 Tax=Acorus calamus TaxID=4465 RepID=A0AAV9C933_ACOCL|nr:Cation/H(+) antiporter 15 [Acorus calamus]